MRETLEQRLESLRQELERGTRMRADLEAQISTIDATLLRISGAVQVLEELLAGSSEVPGKPA